MPLKCLNFGEPIFSFDIQPEEWEILRDQNALTRSLRMPCCDAGVVLKTSKLGTRYFAHARKGPCTTASESAEHILAKSVIAEAVKRAGWPVETEHFGVTSSGEIWIADVLARSSRTRQIAFEVQWSRQTEEETLRRQAKYAEAGVRCMWLMRQHDLPKGQQIPAFRLVFDATKTKFTIKIPSVLHSIYMSVCDKDEPQYWSQSIELGRFIEGALQGKLKFRPALNKTLPLEVDAAAISCWRCKKPTRIITGLTFLSERVLPGCANVHTSIYSFDEIENGQQILASLLPNSLLKQYHIGRLKSRYSTTSKTSYLSNGCAHCDAIMGRFYDHEVAWDSQPIFEVEAYLDGQWATQLKHIESLDVWWFEEEQEGSALPR